MNSMLISLIGQYGHELDPRKPATNALLKDWIKQYADLFPRAVYSRRVRRNLGDQAHCRR
jgi:hypothetical protein